MKLRTLLTLGFLSLSPLALAQPNPELATPPVAPTLPQAPKAPRAAAPARPALASTREILPLPPAAPAAPEGQPPTPPAAPKVFTATTAPAAPAPPEPRPVGQMVNVRIDVVLSDSKGAPKTLTMTVADGESGMNRTKSILAGVDYSFNADARPWLTGNKIRLRLTADALVQVDIGKSPAEPGSKLGLSQSQTVILNDGETVEIARAADPVSDRAFVLTVKATIQR